MLYCHPVVRCGENRFCSPPADAQGAAPPPKLEDIETYLRENFTATYGIVETGPLSSISKVWTPNENVDDDCYVVGYLDGTPADQKPEASIPAETLRSYSQIVWNTLRYSEALAPDERSHLPTEYIRPKFQAVIFKSSSEYSELSQREASIEEVSHHKRVFIWGAAGAGKTSFIRWLAIENSEKAARKPESAIIPLYCRLAGMDHDRSLWDSVLEDMAGNGFMLENDAMIQLSDSGRIQFLFDGLDEVPDNIRNRLFEEIRLLGQRFPLVSIFVTCRPAVHEPVSEEFRHFTIKPFNRSQIAEWSFKKLHGKPERSWKAFVNLLFTNQDLLDMASNPLLLNVVTHIYTRQDILPSNKALVVQTWLEALLNQWDHVRAVSRSNEYWASPRRRFDALYHTAFELCRQKSRSFSSKEFYDWESTQVDGIDAEKTLYSLSAHCGVVRKNRNDNWTFIHQLLLEHCAAAYLVKGSEDLTKHLSPFLSEPLWQNIWLQACAISQDASDLLTLALEHAQLLPLEKTTLIFKAFTQKIRCSKYSFDYCLSFVTRFIEETPIGDVEVQSSGKIGSLICAHEVKYEHPISPKELDSLFNLMSAIYNARRGDLVKKIRPESSNPLVSIIFKIIEFDGIFFAQATHNQKFLLAVRRPDSIPF